MNKEQGIYFNMFLAVQAYLDEQTGVWSAIPRVTTYKNNVDELISRITEKSEAARAGVSVSDRKDALKTGIAVKLSSLSGALQAYAYDKGDTDLAEKVKVSKSDIIQTKDADMDAVVKRVLNEARTSLNELTDFGVTADVCDEIQTSLDEFQALIGKPRHILNKKYVTLETLDNLFDECNDLLRNRMDNIMLMFRESQPEFYQGYERARTIVGM